MKHMNEHTNKLIENSNKSGSIDKKTDDIILQHVTLQEVETMIKNAEIKILQKADHKINEQVQTDKASLITVFGLFASIISFLTIEFQFLKTIDNFNRIIGFNFLLFAHLFGLNLGLDYLVKRRSHYVLYAGIFFSTLILGLIFSCWA